MRLLGTSDTAKSLHLISISSHCCLGEKTEILKSLCVCVCSSAVLSMASVLQKLITPLFSGPLEPPRNKVTVVGVGQVGMACAVSVLLRVRRARRAVIDRDRLYSPFANMLRTLRPQHKHIPGQIPC